MERTENGRKKRLEYLKRQVPTRGLERHPSILKGIFELPAELQSPALAAWAAGQTIRWTIAFPPQIHRGWHYVPQQALLFTSGGVLHVQASIWPDEEPEVVYLEGSGLLYMKVTLLLLYGLLGMVAIGPTAPVRVGVEFNTVAWDLISLPVQQLLQASQTRLGLLPDDAPLAATVQAVVKALPIKFANGVSLYGVLPGEELEELVFQPGFSRRRWLFFRRPVLANTMLLLTTNYVTVMQEEMGVSQGWILSYIPRNAIVGMQSQAREAWHELTVQLARGDQTAEYGLRLTAKAIQGWRARWTQAGGQWQDLPAEV